MGEEMSKGSAFDFTKGRLESTNPAVSSPNNLKQIDDDDVKLEEGVKAGDIDTKDNATL